MEVCLSYGNGVVVEGAAVGERERQINWKGRSDFDPNDDEDELLLTAVFASEHHNSHDSSVIDCLINTYDNST